MGENRSAYTVLVEKPEGKSPTVRLSRRWEDNIKMDIQELEWNDMYWIDVAHVRNKLRAVVDTVMNLISP
jgi:hypothetical protein